MLLDLKSKTVLIDWGLEIQFPKINVIPLVNKPYINEVTLTGQNVPLKCCQLLGLLTQLKREIDL